MSSPFPLNVQEICAASGLDDVTVVLALRLLAQHGKVTERQGRYTLVGSEAASVQAKAPDQPLLIVDPTDRGAPEDPPPAPPPEPIAVVAIPRTRTARRRRLTTVH